MIHNYQIKMALAKLKKRNESLNDELLGQVIAIVEFLFDFKESALRQSSGSRVPIQNTKTERKRRKSPKWPKETPILERIMYMVDKNKKTGCWNWMGAGGDYGMITDKGKTHYVHRLMVELRNNVVLTAKDFVMHTCDNTWCVNPDHLIIGNAKDNRRDCIVKGRTGQGVTYEIAKKIKIAYLQGESSRFLARKYNVGYSTVSNIGCSRVYKELDNDPDIVSIPRLTKQERQSMLRETDVRDIRIMLSKGIPQKEIAKKYNVANCLISRINTGKAWAHIS